MNNVGQGVVTVGIVVTLAILVFGLFSNPDYSSLTGGNQGGVPDPGLGQAVVVPVGQVVVDQAGQSNVAGISGLVGNFGPSVSSAGVVPVKVSMLVITKKGQTGQMIQVGTAVQPAGVQPPGAPPLAQLPEFIPLKIKLSEAHWQGMEALPLSTELKKKLNLPMSIQGVLIDEVSLQAAQSGLLAGDVLVAINGRSVTSVPDMYRESRTIQDRESAALTAYRNGEWLNFQLLAVPGENLGFTQVETAPMVLPGDIRPHPYRGPCTDCHAVGVTGHIVPDPDGVILPPPPIKVGVGRPHQDRGPCVACHKVVP